MSISPVGGPSPYLHPVRPASRPEQAAVATAAAPVGGPVDADGDHDGDTAANDRLDLRG